MRFALMISSHRATFPEINTLAHDHTFSSVQEQRFIKNGMLGFDLELSDKQNAELIRAEQLC